METYTLTPGGEAIVQLLSAVPFVAFAVGAFLLFILAILMPYYVYKTASELRRIRAIAERWETWMRRQNR